jgi:diguanylate cyclase (GGDEF)-like protein
MFSNRFQQLGLRNQILLLTLCLVITTVSILTLSYWFQSAAQSKSQITRHMDNAENVINQYLSAKENLLITASQGVTADFAFKKALAIGDIDTKKSVLDNFGQRINADLMAFVDQNKQLDAVGLASIGNKEALDKVIDKIAFSRTDSQLTYIDNAIYQIIIIPIEAPRIIGYSIVGFKLDNSTMKELAQLTGLSATILHNDELISTSFDNHIFAANLIKSDSQESFEWQENHFKNRKVFLRQFANITIVLSESLAEEKKELNQLLISLIAIACVIILLSILLSSWISSRIINPLSDLIDVTKRLAKGDFSITEIKASSSPEIKELNNAFVAMERAIATRESEIKYQAEHDKLTNLFNRGHMIKLIEEDLSQNTKFILIGINIRQFSQVNDTMGPQTGDQVLQLVAMRLTHHLTKLENDDRILAARLGGDDFLISVRYRVENEISHIVDDVDANLRRPYTFNELTLNLNFRVAVLVELDHQTSPDVLVRRVAIAMGNAKSEQSRVRYYKQGEDEAYLSRLQLLEELRIVLEQDDGQLFLTYQPKLELVNNRVNKAEALIRWINKEGEFINPEMFIDLAEQSGLIVTLTRWVIRQVVKQLSEWQGMGHSFKVAINMSAQDIQHSQFVNYLLDQVSTHNVSAAQIIIELTERDLMDNEELVVERLTYLKSLGFEISVDDYGIGQSSLSKLKQLPIDELKIDKSFVMKLDQSETDQDIVSSTIALGHKLGLRVVAEGVENAESLQLLRTFGCDHIQGYFLSRPIKPDEFIKWYTAYETDTHIHT